MKKQKGLGLINVLLIIGALIITAGGVVVWKKKVSLHPGISPSLSPAQTTPSGITPIPTPPPTGIIGPTVGEPVSPGIFEGDLRDLPTVPPFDIESVRCKTDADCYDEQGNAIGICEVPCTLPPVCENGICVRHSPPGFICLSKNTLIDTPIGPVPVQMLREGMKVWTIDAEGKRQLSPIVKTTKTPVPPNHQMVHLFLADGRELFASPGHPTADGRTLGEISTGDILDGARVVGAELIPYQENYTYDILPAGETSFYWANGILLKSTLAK